ncbi:hypothetical protein IRJ41_013795 [Triplophysa rosa]|uniref:Uncharacterized protein n=1 Tax=Triplophysa rosa TaxID=992332 RepID=A0A9W7WEZ3_TRIRA|nr:hypothetical protein IRJ41_013795 [Triplophysa rosa]
MKAYGLTTKRCTTPSRSTISRVRGHAAFMYTVREQTNPTEMRRFHESRGVSRYILQRVGSEASRLSCLSRHRAVTRREVLQAWDRLRHQRTPAPMAGA